ncbi:aldo/keto reductase [Clavibacter californiensis]|uniref:Aldo/keto reductase n=2 Tax=Clavibacter californiensis TaxID=1401995 RepID=A0ABX9NAC7_9MICO|nr:aldo/keto reductase [Clavibacter californiensis]
MQLRYKAFGNTGLMVSEVGIGSMNLFDEKGPGGASDDASRAILDEYVSQGGNLIDTADVYGRGHVEGMLGKHLHSKRDTILLSTKVGLSRSPSDVNAGGLSRKSIHNALAESLKRLSTDYIDILWAHTLDTLTPREQVISALEDEQRAGNILHFGVSNWPAWQTAAAHMLSVSSRGHGISGIQVKYNLLDRDVETELLPMAHDLGLAVTTWAPLAGGVLSGKYSDESSGGPSRFNDLQRLPDALRRTAAMRVRSLAAEAQLTPAQLALNWLVSKTSPIVFPILGARTHDQLTNNLLQLDAEVPNHVSAAIEQIAAPEPRYPYTFLDAQRASGSVRGRLTAIN